MDTITRGFLFLGGMEVGINLTNILQVFLEYECLLLS